MKMPPPSTIPTDYIAVLLDTVKPFDVSATQLLAGTGVAPDSLDDYFHQTDLGTFILLVDRAIRLSGEPQLGLYFGRTMSLASHGMLGVAASNQSTVGDALDVLMAYAQLRVGFFHFRAAGDARTVEIELSLSPLPDDFARFMGEAFMAFVTAQLNVGKKDQVAGAVCIDVPWAQPGNAARYAGELNGRVRFSRPGIRLAFSRKLLKQKISKANRALANMALAQCQQQLERRARDYTSVVSQMIRSSRDKMLSRAYVAGKLNISESTLGRRLAQEGTDFTTVATRVRFDEACAYLEKTSRSIQEIALLLGYRDASNFGRLFRQQAGCSPSLYRSRFRHA